jgi:hypothetical protein
MEVTATVTHLTVKSGKTSTNQVHDRDGNMWEVFASKEKGLYGRHYKPDDSSTGYPIDELWKENTQYTLKTVIHNGKMSISYNGTHKFDIAIGDSSHYKNLYFKAGDYCQSLQGVDDPSDYCEVQIHSLSSSHK